MGVQIVKLLDKMQIVNIPSGLVPKGAYNALTDYAVGDSVDYNGSSYVMYADAAVGTPPTDTTKWQVLAKKGDTGATGANSTVPGPQGPAGADGAPGVGVPAGGTTGQVLKKSSDTDYATEWGTVSGTGAVDSVNTKTGVVVLNQDDIGDGTTYKQYSATEKTKLAGIEVGANNYTHPATHSADIIVDGTTNKAFTATEKTKLTGIAAGAEVNVQPDWNQATNTADDYIKNKPTIPTSHTQLSDIGTNTHAAIDIALTRLANTSGTNTGDQDLSNYVTKDGAETLTNKTLTAPAIATISNGGTMTIPTGTSTFVTTSNTQTLINKTLTSPKINENVVLTATATQLNTLVANTSGTNTGDQDLSGKLNTTAFSGLSKITVGTTQPTSPSVGDLWVDTN